jgi:DNA-binding GntR family transcriptional regulator
MEKKPLSIERKTLGETIYNEIRNKIISLEIKPGEMIFENNIAAEYGVSRTPVRQAFYILAQEELIKILPQRGARIAYLSIEKVNEAQFIRESLEVSIFEKVAEMWDRTNKSYAEAEEKILAIIKSQKDSIKNKDYIRFIYLDEEFHNSIIETSKNRTLLMVVNNMRAHLNRIRFLELQEANYEKQAILEHEEIFQAIIKNDVITTGKLLKNHLKVLETFRMEIFEKHKDLFK